MMRRTPRNLSQPVLSPQHPIKLITLRLGAMILPIGPKRVAQRAVQLLLQPALALVAAVQLREQRAGPLAPEDAPVLLARAADGADAVQEGRRAGLGGDEPREDQVERLEPHGHGREDLAFGWVGEHALGEPILGAEVAVEVDFGFGEDGEVGLDYDGWEGVSLWCWERVAV